MFQRSCVPFHVQIFEEKNISWFRRHQILLYLIQLFKALRLSCQSKLTELNENFCIIKRVSLGQ